MTPRSVSVVIPVHNDADQAQQAVLSAASQTIPPLEILVIDDGSDEPVANIAVNVRPGLIRVAPVTRVTNRGLPAARNTGLMLAQGAWFLPLDADDTIAPDYLEKTLAEAERTGADVILTGIQEFGQRNGRYPPGFDRRWDTVTADLILADYNRYFYCSLIRTSLLHEIGGYNPKMSEGLEDADLWVDLLRRGAKFAAVEEPLFNYHTGHGMLQTIHANGGYQRMVTEMQRHHA